MTNVGGCIQIELLTKTLVNLGRSGPGSCQSGSGGPSDAKSGLLQVAPLFQELMCLHKAK